ncbi:outer membrane protein assembly factor BamE [Paralimibaculum aggregatum]|uniref:Outer membrane protein assembly factor BamE n=1 Tax=Paralimibaculum aggregatum TaxID=3036245 RepID=A0ABQ6LEB0_9RHOB|nr:outer membrane protein assembly factor BamE [Limibaculum sp. NKW23]GMG81678.1 outer membrane protein assembly factor BamE [Limibaculum sp. NKW23]
MKNRSSAGIALILVAGLAACAPHMRTHGYVPIPEALARIEPGLDTRSSVQAKIGRPSASGAFDETGWYYVSTVVEHYTFYEPKVIDRTVIAVTFDENDVVEAVDRFGLQDGRLVDLTTRTTPTYGRQLTVIEQIVSNLGNVNAGDVFSDED